MPLYFNFQGFFFLDTGVFFSDNEIACLIRFRNTPRMFFEPTKRKLADQFPSHFFYSNKIPPEEISDEN